MKALIVYATNSGGTRFSSEYIQSVLVEKGYEVLLQEAWETNFDTFPSYDIVFLGTNTWFYYHKEGQPHKWYLDRKEDLAEKDLSTASCAIFALGDSSYAQFCHSAEILEEMVKKSRARILQPLLKIDSYHRDEKKSLATIEQWLENILISL